MLRLLALDSLSRCFQGMFDSIDLSSPVNQTNKAHWLVLESVYCTLMSTIATAATMRVFLWNNSHRDFSLLHQRASIPRTGPTVP